jgi:cation transport ATPase
MIEENKVSPKATPGAQKPNQSTRWTFRLWQKKSTVIAALAIAGIAAYLIFRFGTHASVKIQRLPLFAVLLIGGLPMLYELLRKLLKREFGSDLLGGISIITSVILGEYLAGSIIVLMLAGGEALESYALRSASSVLAALAKRMPSVAHRKRDSEIADVALLDVSRSKSPRPRAPS